MSSKKSLATHFAYSRYSTSAILTFFVFILAFSSCNDGLFSSNVTPQKQLEEAKKVFDKDPNDPDALIWYGRRTAYLGQYKEAIDIFTKGVEKHPNDARMLRHRGHRYISTRQYDKAIADLEKARVLIQGTEDQVEPDGLPNKRNIPISTLHSNIWYHLGLAYYLKNDMPKALEAYQHKSVTQKYDDNIVSGGHWLHMIHSRMGNKAEAAKVLEAVHPDMDIIENTSYHNICMFYKGLIDEKDIKPAETDNSPDNVYLYGLGNWYLHTKGDTATARAYYKQLLDKGHSYTFAFMAAESDWERIFKE